MRKKIKQIESLADLRYKMAEKFHQLENGEITVSEAKAYSGIASTMVNAMKVDIFNQQAAGVVKAIDFIESESSGPKQIEGAKEEFFEHDKKEKS